MRMTGSLSLMRSSLAERAVSGDAFQWGSRENSGQKLSPSIYHNPDCVNLKEAYFIYPLKINMGPFGWKQLEKWLRKATFVIKNDLT